jgi:hypothetical protein
MSTTTDGFLFGWSRRAVAYNRLNSCVIVGNFDSRFSRSDFRLLALYDPAGWEHSTE